MIIISGLWEKEKIIKVTVFLIWWIAEKGIYYFIFTFWVPASVLSLFALSVSKLMDLYLFV